MKRALIVFLAACTLAAAMVPRDRRAVNTEEEEEKLRAESSTIKVTETPKPLICEPQTPCAWTIYDKNNNIDTNITNSYCECAVGMICQVDEKDTAISSFVQRCKPAVEPEVAADNS